MSDVSIERHNQLSFRINSATNNVPTAFSTATGSLALSGVALARGIVIINESASRIAVNYKKGNATSAPGATQADVDAYVPAAPTGTFSSMTLDGVDISSTVYIRSDTGSAISSGLIYGWVW